MPQPTPLPRIVLGVSGLRLKRDQVWRRENVANFRKAASHQGSRVVCPWKRSVRASSELERYVGEGLPDRDHERQLDILVHALAGLDEGALELGTAARSTASE